MVPKIRVRLLYQYLYSSFANFQNLLVNRVINKPLTNKGDMLQTRSGMLQPCSNLTTSETGCTPFVHRRCYNVTTYKSFFCVLRE